MSEDPVVYETQEPTVGVPAPVDLDAVLTALEHPDPEMDMIPALPADLIPLLQAETAGRLLRAVVKAETSIDQLEARMKADTASWQALIATQQQRIANVRAIVKNWMERTATMKLQTPWFTASLTKGRTKIVVDDEGIAIAVCKGMGATAAVKTIEKLIKAEFDVAYNSRPRLFDGAAHEEQGEPSLRIQKR